MLTDAEKRALLTAVSRFTPDRAIDHQAFRSELEAYGGADLADFLRSLVQKRVLTPVQAHVLRFSFADGAARAAQSPAPANGSARDPTVAPTLPSLKAPGTAVEADAGVGELFGEFRVLRKLGQGGMSSVYLCYDERERRQVAVKILPERMALSQPLLDRFYREAKSGALLNHPNIVRNLAFGQDQATGRHYLVLEYVDGPTALELLEKCRRLSVGDAVHIILDIARGLEHAHSRNIIHRDIKPDNILLTRTGVAKLADMGLAKRTDEASHLTGTHQGFGTPYYMPYEQAINARHADGRSDIYALGATLYHLITGEVPFAGQSHLEIVEKKKTGDFLPASVLNPEVPPVLDDILERMMAPDPKDRYQTVSELIVDLERANLAPALPSFVDRDLAIQDPLVRERLTAAAQPTSPDLSLPPSAPRPEKRNPDIWYLRYPTDSGQWCKAKATTAQLVRRIREGRIPVRAEASHEPQGAYRPLARIPQFRAALQAADQRPKVETAPRAESPALPAFRSWALDWKVLLGGMVFVGLSVTLIVIVLQIIGVLGPP